MFYIVCFHAQIDKTVEKNGAVNDFFIILKSGCVSIENDELEAKIRDVKLVFDEKLYDYEISCPESSPLTPALKCKVSFKIFIWWPFIAQFYVNFRSYHNYLRITRILKSLGEFDFEHLKANFVKFILYEGMVEYTLDNLIDSCVKYWIGVLRSDEERKSVLDYYEELSEKQKTADGKAKKNAASGSPEPVIKVKTGPSRYVHKYDTDSDSDQDADMAQYNNMDLLADTLPFENNLDSDDEEEKENAEKGDNKDKASGTKKNGNLRIVHDMSDSDTEDFKTPDVDESQEAGYWARNSKNIDGIEDEEEEKNKEIRECLMGEKGDGDQKKKKKVDEGKSVIGKDGDSVDVQKESAKDKEAISANEDLCSDQIDDVISSKDKTVTKTVSEKNSGNDAEKTTQETCDKANIDQDAKQTAIDGVPVEGTGNENDKSTANNEETEEEMPMETGDDGNVIVWWLSLTS